jgi:hypothetical protein
MPRARHCQNDRAKTPLPYPPPHAPESKPGGVDSLTTPPSSRNGARGRSVLLFSRCIDRPSAVIVDYARPPCRQESGGFSQAAALHMLISITRFPFAPLTAGSSNIIYPLDQIVVCPSLCNTSDEIRMGTAQEPPLSRMRVEIRIAACCHAFLASRIPQSSSTVIGRSGRRSGVNLTTSILLPSLINSIGRSVA